MNITQPFLLSETGSTRATSYSVSNKSITVDGKTHVVWLDAVSVVCTRTYHHETGTWGQTHRLFEGCDNHACPTLTIDRDRRLRLVYGPHGFWGEWNHARFKWVIGTEPNQVEDWEREESFGYGATYACMAHTHDDLDVIVYRGGEAPPSLMFQRQRRPGGWTDARPLVRQDIAPQYTHLGAHGTSGPDGTLLAACHLYSDGLSHGVVALKSPDMGETWMDLRGKPITTPTLSSERIAVPPAGEDFRMSGLVVNSAGTPWALTIGYTAEDDRALLSRWNGDRWESSHLEDALPEDRIPVAGVLTVDTRDRLHAAMTAVRPLKEEEKAWGHPTAEVYHVLRETDGSLTCTRVSRGDEECANWQPNISRPGPRNPIEQPVILYTRGVPGEGCTPETTTEVYCAMVR
jgi:hypothetical protein